MTGHVLLCDSQTQVHWKYYIELLGSDVYNDHMKSKRILCFYTVAGSIPKKSCYVYANMLKF